MQPEDIAQPGNIRIRKAILLPLAFALLFLLVFAIFIAFFLQRHQFDGNVRHQLATIDQLFAATLSSEANHLGGYIDFMASDPELIRLFRSKKRGELATTAESIMNSIKGRHQVTHFYFHNLDRTCFLRVHKPDSYGDTIERFTLRQAVETGKPSWGLELGPFGTLTLRIVHPWRVDNTLIGYIELGREVEYIIPVMKEILGYDFFLLVNTRHLNRQMYEEGETISGRRSQWEEIPRHVIIGRTMDSLPPRIIDYIRLPHEEKEDLIFKISHNGKKYRGGFSPLKEVSGREIGEIIAIRDYTNQVAQQQIFAILIFICMGVLGFLFSLFYVYIGKMEKGLVRMHTSLTEEIANRAGMEMELQRHKTYLEESVAQRTAELTETNRRLQIEIAERRFAEESLQDAHDKLEERVKERTEALEKTYDQLLHAEKLSAIGKLSASIAHEFNNPIYGIRNVLEGIRKRQALDEKNMAMVELAIKECDRIAKLTRDLQSFNRPTSGIMAKVNIHEAIEDMLLLVKKEFKQKKITVERQFAPDLPTIRGVQDQIKQVILNILNNAGGAIPEEGGTITITTENRGSEIAVNFRDTGIGIKPEDMDKIFEPFFTTKPTVKGTGLGLSVSYGIIKRHGGRFEVTSQPGKGSIFTILLPIKPV